MQKQDPFVVLNNKIALPQNKSCPSFHFSEPKKG
jgi:hypothetical protein